MTDRKVMFFDIDGTLVREGAEKIDADVLDAIQTARLNGHLMFINTGRTMANMTEALLNAGFDGFVCACGSYIMIDGKRVLYHHTPDDVCALVRPLAENCDLDIIFESWHGIYYDHSKLKAEASKKLADTLEGRYVLFKFVPEGLNFDKFITWDRPGCDLKRFINELSPYYDYVDRGHGFSEFVPAGFSKATGIRFVLDRFGLPLENSYACGDSTNDLTMLRYVKHSIAMGNSSPRSLFDEVEYVTSPIDKGGIIEALCHYGFI